MEAFFHSVLAARTWFIFSTLKHHAEGQVFKLPQTPLLAMADVCRLGDYPGNYCHKYARVQF
jgi:hypothetical protein